MTKSVHSATFPAASEAENSTGSAPIENTSVISCDTFTTSGFELSTETAGGMVTVAFGEEGSVEVVMLEGQVMFGASVSAFV